MIKIDINKAKEISHDMRRVAQSEEFKQLDIEATIPALMAQAEAQRQVIRDEFAVIQTEINSASTVEELKEIITKL